MAVSVRIAAFAAAIRSRVPDGGTVLEIGAGDGSLASVLADAGLRVTAIDRNPRDGFAALAVAFEDYEPATRFDCVAAQLVLHHADDLDAFVAKMARLTVPGGIVAIDDYGWERSDDPEFRAYRAELHTAETMLPVLDRHLARAFCGDHAYGDDGAGDDRIAFTYIGTPRPR